MAQQLRSRMGGDIADLDKLPRRRRPRFLGDHDPLSREGERLSPACLFWPCSSAPQVDGFVRVGCHGFDHETEYYALHGSMRIVLPHSNASYGPPSEAMKLCLPIHFASGAEMVRVRMSYEFAVNPRGTPVDLPACEVTAPWNGETIC